MGWARCGHPQRVATELNEDRGTAYTRTLRGFDSCNPIATEHGPPAFLSRDKIETDRLGSHASENSRVRTYDGCTDLLLRACIRI